LRERLVTHFEIRNLNLKKPKLVAVTGCSEGSGVTTLAGGLAAELSRTGDGNVLLVDMNSEQGVARSFHQGKPGCGIAEVLESDFESDGQGDAAKAGGYPAEGSDKLAKVIPAHFLHMEPKLNMGEYDYIVFDMPTVSPTSPTPRLAAHMDLVLLVLESEKTGQAAAKRAGLLMRESKANVAAILNKFRPHVPAKLSSDA
jgi:Mrp family chromosome partitioning ATPase